MAHQRAGNAAAMSHNPASTTFDGKLALESPPSSRISASSLEIRDAPAKVEQEKAHVTQDDEEEGMGVKEEGEAMEGLKKVKSKHSVRDAGSIPDGGLWAWLQVLGGFFLLFNSW